jgi:hypothetical protein
MKTYTIRQIKTLIEGEGCYDGIASWCGQNNISIDMVVRHGITAEALRESKDYRALELADALEKRYG